MSVLDHFEFVSFQLAYGALDGFLFSSVTAEFGIFPMVVEASVRGIAALAWSGLLPEFTVAEGMTIEAATFWAHAWSVLATYALTGNRRPYPAQVGLLAGICGSIAGAALGPTLQLEEGAIALANSGGVWAGVMAYLLRITSSRTDADWNVTFGIIDVASVAGFATGLLLSKVRLPERSAVMMIDICGILGAAAGIFLSEAFGLSFRTHPMAFNVAVGGCTAVGVGLGAGLAFLSVLPRESEIPAVTVAPTGDGLGLAVHGNF